MFENQLLDTPLEGATTTAYTQSAYRLFQISLGLIGLSIIALTISMSTDRASSELDFLIAIPLFLVVLTTLAGLIFGWLSIRKKETPCRRKRVALFGNMVLFLLFTTIIVSSLLTDYSAS
jgi:F0F1-type ATP synthase assembly protein I